MTEDQIRKIVNDEIKNKLFRFPRIPPHKHDGVDNIKIPETSIVPNTGAMGKVTFATNGKTYTLYFPTAGATLLIFNGFALSNSDQIYVNGTAILKPTYYFQPLSSSTIQTGGTAYPQAQFGLPNMPAQSCSCLEVTSGIGGTTFPHVDQFRLINAFGSSGSSVAAGLLNNLKPGSVDLTVTLTSGWSIVGNFTIV